VAVDRPQQQALSRNLLMSHAVGVGELLPEPAVRAIMAAQINNLCLGHSGVRLELVERLVTMLNEHCIPEVPSRGSVGYLSHMAHIGLVVIGQGHVTGHIHAVDALRELRLAPLVLEAKEGLSLINGTPCALGLASLALGRARALLDWADDIGAMSIEALGGQLMAFDADSLALRQSSSINLVGQRLRERLAGSAILEAQLGKRTQDALCLRAIPHVHGAARDVWSDTERVVARELTAVTDNPAIAGSVDHPRIYSEAHAVGAALALAMDSLATAIASVAAMSERRIDRLVNPLVSGLPAFLSAVPGVGSGLMIAQYTAVSLVADNRRLCAPASLDGGITSGLQEDHLCHATPAALKCLDVVRQSEQILAIELLAATQSFDFLLVDQTPAPGTARLYHALRATLAPYRDDRPLASDIETATAWLRRRPSSGE
jgi:histidine ammonia-lyase